MLDGELCSEVKNTVDEIYTVLCCEARPRQCKKVSVTHSFASGEGIVALVFARVLLRGLQPRRKLVVHSKSDRPFFLHPKEETEAVERALLVHVAVSREEKALTPQVEGLGIDPTRRVQSSALFSLEVEVHDALLPRELKLHHFHGPVFVGSLHEVAVQSRGLLRGQCSLPVGNLGLEEESLEDELGRDLVVKVVAGQYFL